MRPMIQTNEINEILNEVNVMLSDVDAAKCSPERELQLLKSLMDMFQSYNIKTENLHLERTEKGVFKLTIGASDEETKEA